VRLLLAACLLLQVTGSVWACQHDAGIKACHHCCHHADPTPGDDEPGAGCVHCVAHGQTWSTAAASPPLPVPDAGGYWRLLQSDGPVLRFAERLFRPPILIAIS
jgi:hypothetical protein